MSKPRAKTLVSRTRRRSRRFDALALEHLDERRAIDAEQFRGALLVPVRLFERLTDQVIFERLDRLAQVDAAVTEPRTRARFRRAEALEPRGQIARLDHGAAAEEHGAFDRVFELAHVAGPAVRAEHLGGLPRDLRDAVAAGLGARSLEEETGEGGDVLGAVAQGRRRQVN